MNLPGGDRFQTLIIHEEEKKDKDGTVKKDKDGNIVYKEWIGSEGAEFVKNTKAAELSKK